MGNKLGRRRQVVDEKYTRLQGLYQHKDVDHKKLRKLILDSKLAPCYPGDDDSGCDLEDCPICFLCYPSLNRSRCCLKGICTECFLQLKTPNSTRPTQCPFCKASNYAVEYRGVKTKEEKGLEQLEEQRVIEAKIRMRQREILDEEGRTPKQREIRSSSSSTVGPTETDHCSTRARSFASAIESEEIVASHEGMAIIRPYPGSRQNRDFDFDLDLDDIMVMEAIWQSIQENGGHPLHTEECTAEDRSSSAIPGLVARSASSPSGGLACAIAALAERQQTNAKNPPNIMPGYDAGPGCGCYSDRGAENYYLAEMANGAEWLGHSQSEMAEVGTSYGGSGEFESAASPCGLAGPVPGPIMPESFEEQMMLAMAVSLAEARTRPAAPSSVAWQ